MAQTAQQPHQAVQIVSEAASAAPEGQPPPGTFTASSKEDADSNRSSSLSPAPSLQVQPGTSHGHQEPILPGWAALSAQEEEPWQEVKAPRRKPVSQQASSNASAHKARKQRRGAPDAAAPASATAFPREPQIATQHAEQPLPGNHKAMMHPYAPAGHVCLVAQPAPAACAAEWPVFFTVLPATGDSLEHEPRGAAGNSKWYSHT